jgi:hypothetical protein
VLGGQVSQGVAWQLGAKIGRGLFEERRDGIRLFAKERAEWSTPAGEACAWAAGEARTYAAPPGGGVRTTRWQSGILARASDGLIQLVNAYVQTTGQRLEKFLPRTLCLRLRAGLGLSSSNPNGRATQNKNRYARKKTLLDEM